MELNYIYMALYSFVSMTLLGLFLIHFRYARVSQGCYLKFISVIKATPGILMIYLLTVVYFMTFSFLISNDGLTRNRTVEDYSVLFLNEFQQKQSNSIKVDSRSELKLLFFISLYLFGIIVLFTSIPFAYLNEGKRRT